MKCSLKFGNVTLGGDRKSNQSANSHSDTPLQLERSPITRNLSQVWKVESDGI